MSDFQAGIGRTDPMWSLPSISDPVLTPTASDSPPIDPIRVMFERLVSGMARMEARMDDYDRRPPYTSRPEPEPPYSRPSSSRNPPRPEPDPPYSSANAHQLEVAMPYIPQFATAPVAMPSLPATAPFLNLNEGFRPIPSGASNSWDLSPALRGPATWDLPPLARAHTSWDLPPTSRAPPPWDAWGNRFSDHHAHGGRSSWGTPRQHTPEKYPAYDQSFPHGWCPMSHQHSTIYPSEFKDLGSGFSSVGEGRSEFMGYPKEYWDSNDQWDAADSRCLSPLHLHHVPSTRSLPTAAAIPPPPASISLSCSPDFRYDSKELIADDNDETIESCPNTTIDRLSNRDQVGAEEVLLDVEEKDGFLQAFEVANFEYVDEAEKAVDEEVPAPPSEGLGCSSLAFVLAEEIGPMHIEKYSQLASPIVPPSPPQRSPSCWSPTGPTSHCCSAAPLPAAAAAPSLTRPPPAPPCSPDIMGVEEALLDGEEKVGSFAILRFARVRGEKCSSRDKVERNELLRAHCLTFGILEELVNHSSPIGGVGFSKGDISFCSTLNLIQSERMAMVTNGAAFIPRRHSWPFDPGGDISHLAYVISDSLRYVVVPTLRTRWILTAGELIVKGIFPQQDINVNERSTERNNDGRLELSSRSTPIRVYAKKAIKNNKEDVNKGNYVFHSLIEKDTNTPIYKTSII